MKVGIGLSDHTGWAVLVAAGVIKGAPAVVDRQRITLYPDDQRFAYHAAVDMELAAARASIRRVERVANDMAASAIADAVKALHASGHDVVGAAVAIGARELPEDLAARLASHAFLHASEGELYREALVDAAVASGLDVTRFVQRDLWDGQAALRTTIDGLRKSLGPPWTKDHKDATAAALLCLD